LFNPTIASVTPSSSIGLTFAASGTAINAPSSTDLFVGFSKFEFQAAMFSMNELHSLEKPNRWVSRATFGKF
jgi:hypothetical protein